MQVAMIVLVHKFVHPFLTLCQKYFVLCIWFTCCVSCTIVCGSSISILPHCVVVKNLRCDAEYN